MFPGRSLPHTLPRLDLHPQLNPEDAEREAMHVCGERHCSTSRKDCTAMETSFRGLGAASVRDGGRLVHTGWSDAPAQGRTLHLAPGHGLTD